MDYSYECIGVPIERTSEQNTEDANDSNSRNLEVPNESNYMTLTLPLTAIPSPEGSDLPVGGHTTGENTQRELHTASGRSDVVGHTTPAIPAPEISDLPVGGYTTADSDENAQREHHAISNGSDVGGHATATISSDLPVDGHNIADGNKDTQRLDSTIFTGGLKEDIDFHEPLLNKQCYLDYHRSLSYPIANSTYIQKAVTINQKPKQRSKSFDIRNKKEREVKEDVLHKQVQKLEEYMSLLESSVWSKETGFTKMSCLTQEQKMYYFLENQLLLFYEKSTVCPLCTRYCEEKKKSHIFPNSLWREYSNIHCKGDEDFIYDFSPGEKKRSRGLTYPLLCGICETKASREEDLLKHVYVNIMGLDQDKQLHIKADFADILKHILAILLFRGIMVWINFWEESLKDYYNKFLENFIDLRNYCTADINDPRTKEMQVSKKIHLFLLRNGHFNPNNIDPTYILDLQLRIPQYTTIVNSEGKVFLYTKFDCFHCILPITDNCHSLMENSCFANYTKEDGIVLPTAYEAIQLFPQTLLDFNLSKTSELLGDVLKIRFPRPFQCLIQSQLLRRMPVYYSKYPVQAGSEQIELQRDHENLLEKARNASPLVNRTYKPIIEKLSKDLKAAEEKSKADNDKFQSKKKECNKLKNENKKLVRENEKLKTELKECKENLNARRLSTESIEEQFALVEPISAID